MSTRMKTIAFLVLALPTASLAQNPIVTENDLPGSPPSEWDVSGAGDANIQGYATDISIDQGETVYFKVKTDATDYKLDIYRLGYYDGDGARFIATVEPTATLPQVQPTCDFEPVTKLLDCGNWEESAHWDVPISAVSGVYIAKLVREDGTPGAIPSVTSLHPAAPNPFNPATTISYDIAVGGRVSLKIYSFDGRLLRTLVDAYVNPGRFKEVWQGRDQAGRRVASGAYVIRMVTPDRTETRRMILLK
jgi:hypothetical protein